MNKLIVFRANPIVFASFCYCLLGIFFLMLQVSLQINTGFLTPSFFLNFAEGHIFSICSILVLAYFSFIKKNIPSLIFRINIGILVFYLLHNLYFDFNKIILFLIMIFLMGAYVFDQLINEDFINSVVFLDKFQETLYPPSVGCPVIKLQQGSHTFKAQCIRWSHKSLVVLLDHPLDLKENKHHLYKIAYEENQVLVEFEGLITAHNSNLQLFSILVVSDNGFSWPHLVDVWADRGLTPEGVR